MLDNINLNELSLEQLEKVKMILDLNKIQQDVAESRATVEKMRADTERHEREHQANIAKIQAETLKIQKEAKFYPYLVILTAIGSGFLATLVTLFLK